MSLPRPEEDYPRVLRIRTHGKPGLLRLRTVLERLASRQLTTVDILSDLPAVSARIGRCRWHAVATQPPRTVTLEALPDGRLGVEWYEHSPAWRERLDCFDAYLAQIGEPLVGRDGEIVDSGPRIACLYPDDATAWDAVFEAAP